MKDIADVGEIEITPEMIEAAAWEVWSCLPDSIEPIEWCRSVAEKILRAALAARCGQKEPYEACEVGCDSA